MATITIVEALGEQTYKHDLGTHGYPLPGIKAWNNAVKFLQREIKPEWILRGSIDDLADASCSSCGGELIRVGDKFNDFFRVGSIRCVYAGRRDSPDHPKEYWAEIWPNANFPKNTQPEWHNFEPETPEEIANYFRLSDSKIKRSFARMSLEWYPYEVGMTEDWYSVNSPSEKYIPEPLPKPDFVHK